jgi:hypothetical protein
MNRRASSRYDQVNVLRDSAAAVATNAHTKPCDVIKRPFYRVAVPWHERKGRLLEQHAWLLVTAPNGDQGWRCARCRLTTITMTDRLREEICPVALEAAKAPLPDAAMMAPSPISNPPHHFRSSLRHRNSRFSLPGTSLLYHIILGSPANDNQPT